MKQYLYQADWLCEPCARSEATWDRIELGVFDGDSDDGPVGPYEDLAADYPCHCAGCDVFLKNELTDDGIAYVREQIAEQPHPTDIVNEWRNYYNL